MEITKQKIKDKAQRLASFLGYDTTTEGLHLINLKEMYCQGYLQALEDIEENKTITIEGQKTTDHTTYDDTHPDYIKSSQEEI